ncbi:MAG: SEC-C metal-binding domain-containing protein, partial [Enterobacter sp.]
MLPEAFYAFIFCSRKRIVSQLCPCGSALEYSLCCQRYL